MIIGENVSLREISIEDTNNIVIWRNKVKHNFFIQDELTHEQHCMWYENKVKNGEVVQFIIVDNQNKKDIGSIFLRDIDFKNKKSEFGIFIGEDDARGRGVGTEAAMLICKFGFNELNLNKIFLRVFEHNLQAVKSYEKAGFEREALLRQEICIEGIFYNIILMSKLSGKK